MNLSDTTWIALSANLKAAEPFLAAARLLVCANGHGRRDHYGVFELSQNLHGEHHEVVRRQHPLLLPWSTRISPLGAVSN